MRAVVLFGLLFLGMPANAGSQEQRILHLLDYVSIDYPKTVVNREIINPDEYAEQLEFAAEISNLIAALPDNPAKNRLMQQAVNFVALITQKSDAAKVTALAAEMKLGLVAAFGVATAPDRIPDLRAAAAMFQNLCASCHGAGGKGDGKLAAALTPRPNDFHDAARQSGRSVYGLYNTISLGVAGTAMQGFSGLIESERWALAFYVSRFNAADAEREEGAALWREGKGRDVFHDLKQVTTVIPQEIAERHGAAGVKILAYLRSNPSAVMKNDASPVQFALEKLRASLASYRAGDREGAYRLAVTAYVEGFELAETGLNVADPQLRTGIEKEMANYRAMIKRGASGQVLSSQLDKLQQMLGTAEEKMQTSSISPGVGFISALGILVREGVEAILILAAIIAFLIKTGRRDALPYIHAGWIASLLLGIATWFMASYVVEISGAGREMTEGVTALLASAILLYVSFWLLNKVHVQRWKHFIESKVRGALKNSTLWMLAVVAFIAVYREVFETVLFYQALWAQTGPGGGSAILAGVGAGALILVVLAWGIFRLGMRLPLRLFFGVSSGLLYVLAVVFAGKGVAALQEAGKLPVAAINFPQIDVLGIYPNLQSLGLQFLLVAIALIGLAYTFGRSGKPT